MIATRRIAVLGTGANGACIGADLTRASEDVVFIEQWSSIPFRKLLHFCATAEELKWLTIFALQNG
ncbi:MAG: 2-dehydropantoate 2-reductase N-terminal domain-containing protein [Actinomycetes bacterium]